MSQNEVAQAKYARLREGAIRVLDALPDAENR